MDFDETLRELLGLMGTVVAVHVRSPGSRVAPALMLVSGKLRSAPEVVEQLGGSSEVFFCRVGDGKMLSGFFLDRARMVEGKMEFTRKSKEESDGSLGMARRQYDQLGAARALSRQRTS